MKETWRIRRAPSSWMIFGSACTAAVSAALMFGCLASAALAITGTTSAESSPKVCSLLPASTVNALLGGSGATTLTNSSTECTLENGSTGAEGAIYVYTVTTTNTLKEYSDSSIGGRLDCASAATKVTGGGGELGFYCHSSGKLDIQEGTIQLDISGTPSAKQGAFLAVAVTLFTKLGAKRS